MAELELQSKVDMTRKLSSTQMFATLFGMGGVIVIGMLGLILGFICIMAGYPAGAFFLAAPVVAGAPRIIEAINGKRREADPEPKSEPDEGE